MKFTANNENELVEKIWSIITANDAPCIKIGLIGDLGAGKTTLVKGLAHLLGVKAPVTSPTFTISKEYRIEGEKEGFLRHLDLYRFDNVLQRDFQEIMEIVNLENGLVAIEWVEKMPALLGQMDFLIKIKIGQGDQRIVEVEKNESSNKH